MASVAVKKSTTSEVCGGRLPHNYRDHTNYGNEDIDTTKSFENINLGCSTSTMANRLYRKMMAHYDAIIPPKRLKKDRVTSVELSITAPRENINAEDQELFLRNAWKALKEKYGVQVICGNIHKDEVHEYCRLGEEHTSRYHMHVVMMAYTPEHGINGKHYLTKDRYKEYNELMDAVCMEQFGFPYQDGTKQRSRGTVEELKQLDKLQKCVFDTQQLLNANMSQLERLKQVEELEVALKEYHSMLLERETSGVIEEGIKSITSQIKHNLTANTSPIEYIKEKGMYEDYQGYLEKQRAALQERLPKVAKSSVEKIVPSVPRLSR